MPPVDTHCPYCALQCGMTLRLSEAGRVDVHSRDFPTNQGGLCQKGWTAAELLDHPERLTTPLLHGQPATWDAPLDHITRKIRELQATYGRDAIAVFGGGGLTNEKGHALGRFARVVLRTRYVDYNGRFCMSSAAAAGTRSLRVERRTGFPGADREGVARALGSGGRTIIVTARGAEQQARGTETVSAFINLALALGLPGRPGSG